MTEAPKDGGPAFPANELDQRSGNIFANHLGMSLRDWFAGHWMMGIAAGYEVNSEPFQPGDLPKIAKDAYEAADAMLAARSLPQ
jgi:hypothetical protein